MRTTLNLEEDALLAARPAPPAPATKGRFALLPERDEVITAAHVRALMDREGL